jgi:hypothetical protein
MKETTSRRRQCIATPIDAIIVPFHFLSEYGRQYIWGEMMMLFLK